MSHPSIFLKSALNVKIYSVFLTKCVEKDKAKTICYFYPSLISCVVRRGNPHCKCDWIYLDKGLFINNVRCLRTFIFSFLKVWPYPCTRVTVFYEHPLIDNIIKIKSRYRTYNFSQLSFLFDIKICAKAVRVQFVTNIV